MAFDSNKQRDIMGRFATGVTVVSTIVGENDTWGMTANAVTSLSLDPPLVLVAVQKETQTYEYLKISKCFAISILAKDQQVIADRFAFKGPKDFSGLETKTALTGAPVLSESLGWIDCRLTDILPGGDHDIFVGEVVDGDVGHGEPLLFYSGNYTQLASQ